MAAAGQAIRGQKQSGASKPHVWKLRRKVTGQDDNLMARSADKKPSSVHHLAATKRRQTSAPLGPLAFSTVNGAHMKLSPATLALAIATALVLPYPAHAEHGPDALAQASGPGMLIGQVKEANQGLYLQGASISIDGRQTHTDADGGFRIAGLAPSRHTLQVSYMGYQRYSSEVIISEQAATRVEISLHSNAAAAERLDQVVVRGLRDAQSLALNQQRSSDNLVNVVSADLLGQFPDNNIAESTQRIAGVAIERDQGEGRYVSVRGAPKEFTTVTLDGVPLANPDGASRGVELDTIPADVISALEVTKALTPDMDGDAIAGNINIRTQSALDRDGMTLRASLASGRFQLGSGDNRRAAATFGQRFGAERNIGVLVSASHSRQERFTDNVETLYMHAADGRILPEEVQIKDYQGVRTRNGVNARFDWRINADHQINLSASHSKFTDHEFRDNLYFTLDRHSRDASQTTGIARTHFSKELRERTYNKSITTLSLGGDHWLGEWKTQWQAARSVAEKTASPRMQYVFRSGIRPQMQYDYGNPDFPVWTLLGRSDAPASGVNVPESWFDFRRLNNRREFGEEKEASFRLDFSRGHALWGGDGDIRFGLRSRLREKSFDDERYRNGDAKDFAALGISLSDMLCSELGESNNFGYFHAGRRFCRDTFARHAGALIASPNHKRMLAESTTGDYRASEDIHAAYLRLDQRWQALSLIAGLRLEHTRIEGEAAHFNRTTLQSNPQQASHRYTHLLPSLHLRYALGEDSILRAAYSTGINRPDFRHTAPYRTRGELETSPISEGNPGIKAAYAHNLDLSLEHYLQPLGQLSAALFYKRLRHPLFVANSHQQLASGERVRITRPENGQHGHVHGFELAWQQSFDSLPAPFDGLGVYANYTWAKSRAELPFNLGSTELPGTSRHNYNLAVSYEKRGFNARLSWNHRGKFIQEFDIQNPALNVYWGERSNLDLSASYAFNKHFRVFVEANNLTDTRQIRFQGERSRVMEMEGFGRSYLLGLRYQY
ncbi:TonB-dependent receptor [Lysobacteraceae bacterium NML07-0707]|nr:TonB-dependent receptor [Xanthomonadaceae bacterium NML07-0707]